MWIKLQFKYLLPKQNVQQLSIILSSIFTENEQVSFIFWSNIINNACDHNFIILYSIFRLFEFLVTHHFRIHAIALEHVVVQTGLDVVMTKTQETIANIVDL